MEMWSSREIPPTEALLEHAQWVTKLARDLVRDRHVAEDIVQETWLAFLRRPPGRGHALRPWLARVVRNQASMYLRGRGARSARERDVARPEASLDTAEIVERGELQRELIDAVLGLAEPYRTTLLLRYYEELSPSQIARVLGVRASSVRSRLVRGQQKLRAVLDQRHGGNREEWARRVGPLLPLATSTKRAANGAGARYVATWITGAVACGALVALVAREIIGARSETPSADPAVHRTATGSAGPIASAITPDGRRRRAVAVVDPDAARVTVVDPTTQTGVPDLVLAWDGGRTTTDHDGRATIPRTVDAVRALPERDTGTLAVDAHGVRSFEPARPRRLVRGGADGTRIEYRRGPSLELELHGEPVEDVTRLGARLGPENDTPFRDHGHAIHVARLGAVDPALGRAMTSEGTLARVRFDPAAWDLERLSAGEPVVEVRDDEGHLRGRASTRSTARDADFVARVRLELVPTGRIDGVLEAERGPVEGLVVSVVQDGRRVVAQTLSTADGSFSLRWIPPGSYEMWVDEPGYEFWRDAIEVRERHDSWRVVELTPRDISGRVAGRVLATSRDFDEQLLVFLRDEDGHVLGVVPPTWTERGEERVAPFKFDDVASGPLTIDVVSLASAVTFEVQPSRISAPLGTVEIRANDHVAHGDLEVDVIDSASGRAIESFVFEAAIDGGPARSFERSPGDAGSARWAMWAGGMRWNDFDGTAPLRALPRGTPVSWLVRAPGYENVSGTEVDFVTASDGHTRSLRVSLQRSDR